MCSPVLGLQLSLRVNLCSWPGLQGVSIFPPVEGQGGLRERESGIFLLPGWLVSSEIISHDLMACYEQSGQVGFKMTTFPLFLLESRGDFSLLLTESLVEFLKKVKRVKAWGPPGVLILRIVCSDLHPPPAILSIQVQDFLPQGWFPQRLLLMSLCSSQLQSSVFVHLFKVRGSVLPVTSCL